MKKIIIAIVILSVIGLSLLACNRDDDYNPITEDRNKVETKTKDGLSVDTGYIETLSSDEETYSYNPNLH